MNIEVFGDYDKFSHIYSNVNVVDVDVDNTFIIINNETDEEIEAYSYNEYNWNELTPEAERFFGISSNNAEGDIQSSAIELPKYTAKINIGDWEINLTNKTFTEEQIKNMKEMLGWEVKNL